ncbi:MAG: sulfite exporter TauE/SafE family protein [Geobacteraceae bacterium]|nr:sulfite exporter TauE/SafE family protein [Geobacteraceae bacterium]
MIELFTYIGLGVAAGLLAGLLGVGGGIVIVPMLTVTFAAQHIPQTHIQHLALGTSLATIVFTSIASLRAHHARGAVDWQTFRRITPGILFGTFSGSWFAAALSGRFLKIFFIIFTFIVAWQMLSSALPKASRQIPGVCGLFATGSVIGGISSLVGIGGGSMSVPFLIWCNTEARKAIGTSAAIGFPIALSGAAGYIVNGLKISGLPPYSLGYIYLPALAGIAVTSYLTAPLGAKLAHNLPISKLKKGFAVLLILTGSKMLYGLL